MVSRHARIRPLAAALIAATAAAVLSAAPASANSLYGCDSGAMCVWRDANFATGGGNSSSYQFQYYQPNFANVSYAIMGGSVNQSVTSVYNNGNYSSAMLFDYTYAGGWGKWWAKQTYTAQLTGTYNDDATSGYFCGYTSRC